MTGSGPHSEQVAGLELEPGVHIWGPGQTASQMEVGRLDKPRVLDEWRPDASREQGCLVNWPSGQLPLWGDPIISVLPCFMSPEILLFTGFSLD